MFQSLLLAVQVAAAAGGVADAESGADRLVAQSVPANQIAIGASVQGDLTASDPRLNSGEYWDEWMFEGAVGDRVRLTMRSSQFDTYLGVTGPGGFVDASDDAPGMGTNSALDLTITTAGRYTVQATSYAPGSMGSYTLSLAPATAAGPAPTPTANNNAPQPTRIASGTTTNGQLATGDGQLGSGEFFDAYLYQGTAGERLSVSLSSTQFDPYLMMRGPGGFSQDNDDRQEGSLDSALGVTLPENGEYRIVATSYSAGERGAYTLGVTSGGMANTVVGGRLTAGTPVQGSLTGQDPTRAGGQHFQSWTFNGTAGQMVTINLESSDLDTFVILQMPDGTEQTNDYIDRRDTNSRVHANLTHDGVYTVLATTYLAGATGTYSLALATSTVSNVMVTEDSGDTEGGPLAIGGSVSGRLTRRDTQLDSGEYYDTLSFQGRAGQGITLTMESGQFDTYVMIRGPGGLSLDNDDGFSTGTNSRLEATLPQDGVYSVLATSYAPGENGRYTIAIDEGTMVQQSATGRVYAILAGISDYDDANDLPFCAEDAVKLGEALGETGIMAPESIVLTDGQVTRANLESAFLRVAQAAGPNDVFLFFYSGHGAFLDGRSELDGRDETLYVHDGHITDDQIATWFDSVNARLGIIALDSCFSGGFARDVISAPNRMGIFSSEEDVTSNVASRFQAGGYLSYFLRNGIAGGADADPRDGIITAGELSQYLRRQWAANNMANESTETSDSAAAYQNLVIDRGSVKVTDVLVYSQ